ncbi:hypothetical protein [Frankia sp. Cas4]|uniref:hypothetical protein n=1 Tax=Frankia sp. Cas4 TaxID=3073927 RepID=UPI002AD25F4E|nr:hypothetical protein [Frankia sp. Cas4]
MLRDTYVMFDGTSDMAGVARLLGLVGDGRLRMAGRSEDGQSAFAAYTSDGRRAGPGATAELLRAQVGVPTWTVVRTVADHGLAGQGLFALPATEAVGLLVIAAADREAVLRAASCLHGIAGWVADDGDPHVALIEVGGSGPHEVNTAMYAVGGLPGVRTLTRYLTSWHRMTWSHLPVRAIPPQSRRTP